MFEPVAIPGGLLVALIGLAALALYRYLVAPLFRWVIGRRSSRVIAEVNPKLQLRLAGFSLTKRSVLADRLANDPVVVEAVEAEAAASGQPIEKVRKRVAKTAYEIVPAFNPYFYFRIGYWAARALLRYMYRVRLGYIDSDALAKVSDEAAVIFFMNHRTNMDYVLVTYVTAQRTTLSYGIGEWARVWPIQPLMRAAGGYFLRRDSRDPLYRRVLERYVQLATEARVPHAIFPEGALSRDGGLQAPRLGLLGYITRTFDPVRGPDLVFVPIGTNYDRVPEERTVNARADESFVSRGTGFVLSASGKFIWYLLSEAARGRRQPFGYACANFGAPVSFKDWLRRNWVDWPALDKQEKFYWLERFSTELMGHVRQLIPLLPNALVCAIMHHAGENRLTEEALAERFEAAIEISRARGAYHYLPDGEPALGLEEALRSLTRRRILLRAPDGAYSANQAERGLIAYYANSIAQFWPGDDAEPS